MWLAIAEEETNVKEKSLAKADGTNAVTIEYDAERDEYKLEMTPSRIVYSTLSLKRSQIALVIAALQEVLSDYEA